MKNRRIKATGNFEIDNKQWHLSMCVCVCVCVYVCVCVCVWKLTFPLETFCPEETDNCEELGDLLEVDDSGVVQADDGRRLLVIGWTAARVG